MRKRRGNTASLLMAVPLTAAVSMMLMAVPALASEKTAVVRLWDQHVHDKKFRKQIFNDFNRDNPDIKVEYTSQVGGSYSTVLEASFRTGDPPDLFVAPEAADLLKLKEMGRIIPIDEVAPSKSEMQKWVDRFPRGKLPFVDTMNMIDGKIYSWPTSGAGSGGMFLFWNVKLFREAGLQGPGGGPAVPETWDDMRSFAKKITDRGQGKVFGIVHGIKNPGVWDQDIFWSLAVSSGGVGASPDLRAGRYDFHGRDFRGPIQLWLDMKNDGSIFPGDLSMDDEQAKYKFSQGLAGMIFGGHWVPGGLIAVTDALEFDVALPPIEKRGQRNAYFNIGELAGNSEYYISSRTKNKEAVWKVVNYMISQHYQEEWVKAGGGFSLFAEYNKPEFFPHPTLAKIATMIMVDRRTRPKKTADAVKAMEYFDPGMPDLYQTMQGIWIGKLGMDALDELERRYNNAMDAAIAEGRKRGLAVTLSDYIFPDWDPSKDYVTPAKK